MSTTSPPQTPSQDNTMWKALAALCVGLFIVLMDQSMIAVALPQIIQDFDASMNQAIWVSAVYLLTFAVPLLVTGRLGDRFGYRNMYVAGMGVVVFSALLCALAPSIEMLIAARALQGLGGSLLNPQPLSVINRVFPITQRGRAMGIWSAVAGSSGLFGPVVGGMLVGTVGWRWIFVFYIPVGLVALFLVYRWVPKLPTVVTRIDVVSALVSLLAILGIVFTLQQGPEIGWPPWLFAVLLTGVLAMVVFIWLQHRSQRLGKEPLLPLSLFTFRNYRWGLVSVATLGFAVYSMHLPIMMYLQLGAGMTPQTAGLLVLPMAITSVSLAPLMGRLADKLPPGRLSVLGFSSLIFAVILFATLITLQVSPGWLIIPMVFQGAANALSWSSNAAISMRQLPVTLIGAGSGAYNTSRQVGAVLGAAALGAVMQINLANFGFSASMGLSLLLHVAVLFVGLLAVSRFRPDLPSEN